MLGIVIENGFSVVDKPEDATFIIINTCGFINDAKKESIRAILELGKYKKTAKCQRLIVAGCLVQRYLDDLKKSLPEVDAFIGTAQYPDILKFLSGTSETSDGFSPPMYIHSESTPRLNSQPAHRAYLKISEGCIKNCAFCIIPRIRGTLRSRSISSLVLEAQKLVTQGTVELNLVAQNLTDYGKDLKDGTNLSLLLEKLVEIEGLRWIRLLYIYPDELSDALLDLIANEEKICKYLDIPIQHINDRMLKLMNRNVTGHQIQERLHKIRERIPDIFLRSTLLVGYPGETEKEFKELERFVSCFSFDHLGVFSYSKEENTPSYDFPRQCRQQTKDRRVREIMTLQKKISQKRLIRLMGLSVPVLVEQVSEESEYLFQGRHEGQAPDIDGLVLIRGGKVSIGAFAKVKIEKAFEYNLIGIAE